MTRVLGGLAVVLLTAALVMFAIAIWSGDSRWAMTALLPLFPGLAIGSATAMWSALSV